MHRRFFVSLFAALCFAARVNAATLYSDDFNVDDSASWNINKANTASSSTSLPVSDTTNSAEFGYDYGTNMGIPVAPHTTDSSTKGLRLRSNISGGISGAVSVSPTGLSLPAAGYRLQFDAWGNFVNGGANSTEAMSVGIGTTGTVPQWSFNPNGALGFATVRDGGTTNTDFRVYLNSGNQAATTGYYQAGNTAASLDNANSYYSFLPAQTVPVAQVTLFPTQAGTATPVGTISFAWHTVTVDNDGTDATWSIDGKAIAVVPLSAATLAGSNFYLGSFDTNNGSSSGNGQLLNFDLIDNLSVISVPEPSTIALCLLGAMGLVAGRRRG